MFLFCICLIICKWVSIGAILVGNADPMFHMIHNELKLSAAMVRDATSLETWVDDDFTKNIERKLTSPSVLATDLQILGLLYTTLGGYYWIWKTPFTSYGIPWNFSNPYPCQNHWQGIQCTNFTPTTYFVTVISLPETNLRGQLPAAIGSFPFLGYLDLSKNIITGTIPPEIGSLVHVQYLDLSFNSLQGTIPPQIGQLGKLQYLSLYTHHDAGLTGTLPQEIGDLSSLVYLIAGTVIDFDNGLVNDSPNLRISGNLPPEITKLTRLLYLYMYGTQFTGTIPYFLGSMTSLEALILGQSHQTGSLPSELGSMSSLRYLVVGSNRLTGALPSELGKLSSLNVFSLNNNMFTGTLPDSFAGLTALNLLYLHGNLLSGTLHSSLGDIASLNILSATDNYFTGTIPPELSKLSNLTDMLIAWNMLSSTIPSQIGVMSAMNVLEISNNQLTGRLPTSLGSLKKLSILNSTHNKLSGPIPKEIGNLQSLVYLNIMTNSVSGTLPSELRSLTALKFVVVTSNHLCGTIPAWIHDWISVETVDLKNNSFVGTIPSTIGRLHAKLMYLDLSYNSLSGYLPLELFHLTSLRYLTITHTLLQGTISSNIANMSSLRNIRLRSNRLGGSLCSAIFSISALQLLDLSSNMLRDRIPSAIKSVAHLQYLFLQGNKFEGDTYDLVNATLQVKLQSIDISDNAFSGTLGGELFSLQSLRSFAAVRNCFSGTLPDAMCLADTMEVLALDGVSTAVSCQEKYYIFGVMNSYGLTKKLTGRIPRCLYSLPKIHTLHLSGNDITDKIPNNVNISSTLEDLSLSHNNMYGTIPIVIQNRHWKNLDLSFNKFYGTLSDDIKPLAANASLRLLVNRLSGSVPRSMYEAQNISILDGNLFECNVRWLSGSQRSQLPKNDDSTAVYQCADTFQQQSYAWGAPFVLSALVIITIMTLYHVARSSIEKVRSMLYMAYHWFELLDNERYSSSRTQRTSTVYLLKKFLIDWLRTCSWITAYNFCILLPVWFILTGHYSTYQYEYSWSASFAYISGYVPTIIAIVLLTIALMMVFLLSTTNAVRHRQRRISNFVPIAFVESPAMKICSGLLVAAVLTFNFVSVLTVNVFYVIATVKYGEGVVTFSAVALVLFKLFWSEVVLERACCMGLAYLEKIFPAELVEVYDRRILWMRCFLGLINDIGIPFVATAIISSTCFRFVFQDFDEVKTSYTFEQCAVESRYTYNCREYETVQVCNILAGVVYDCTGVEVGERATSYIPPFDYSYQCSSTFLSSYAAVFVYAYLVVAFAPPIATSLIVNLISAFDDNDWRKEWLYMLLPNFMRTCGTAKNCNLFDKRKFIVAAVTDTAMLITFGGVFPPLSFVILFGIGSRILCLLLGIGRLLKYIDDSKNFKMKTELLQNCQDVPEIFGSLLWLLLPFASIVFSFFLLDTYGEEVGWEKALWAPLLMLFMPAVFRILFIVYMRKEFKRMRAFLLQSWKKRCAFKWTNSVSAVSLPLSDGKESDGSILVVGDASGYGARFGKVTPSVTVGGDMSISHVVPFEEEGGEDTWPPAVGEKSGVDMPV